MKKTTAKRPSPVDLGDGWHLRVVRGPNASSQWYWRAQKRIDGRQHTAFSGWGTIQQMVSIFEAKKRDGTLLENTEKPKAKEEIENLNQLVSAWVHWREESGAKPKTIEAYRVSERRMMNEASKIRLNDHSEAEFDSLKKWLRSNFSDKTVNLNISIIQAAWNWGLKRRMFTFAPCPIELIKKPVLAREKYTPTANELDIIQGHLSGWMRLAFIIARYTGCRVGELERLSWSQISIRNCTMTLNGKTGSRTIPIPKLVLVELQEWITSHPFEKYNIFQRKPSSIRNTFSAKISRIAAENGIRRVTVHSLRRAFIDHMRKKKIDVGVAAKIVGHSPAMMLSVYAQVAAEELKDAMRTLDG